MQKTLHTTLKLFVMNTLIFLYLLALSSILVVVILGKIVNNMCGRIFIKGSYQFGTLLPSKWQQVVRLIPLPEGGSVHHDNSILHQRLGTHQLIVRCIVDYIDDTGLASGACNRPFISGGCKTIENFIL